MLVEPGAEEETILRLWRSTWPEEQLFPVEHAADLPRVPMRDGVHLSTNVYLPKNCSTPGARSAGTHPLRQRGRL